MNHKLNLKKQLACIYTNNFFSGLRITDAVWVALLAARGFSLWEIGVAESVFHVVSLTFEVPSGMAADLLGRRKTLVAGGVCMVLSNLLMAFAPDLFFICLAMALSALANAMFSGTASALTYDSLKQCGRTDDYLRVSANCSQLSMLATAVGSLASTLERFLRFSGFYLLSAAFEGTAAAATALMTEPIVTETQARREKQTFRDLPGQLARLVRDSITALRATPLAAKLIVSAAVLCIPSYLTKMFVQQRLIELGWPTALLFVPMLLSGLASMLGVEAARRLHPESLRRFYAVCALLCGGGCRPGAGLHLRLYAGAGRHRRLSPARGPEAQRCHPQRPAGHPHQRGQHGLQPAHDTRQPPCGRGGRRLRAGRCRPCRAGRPRGADRRGGAWPKDARLLNKKRTAGFLDSRPAMRYNSDRKGTVTSGLASF